MARSATKLINTVLKPFLAALLVVTLFRTAYIGSLNGGQQQQPAHSQSLSPPPQQQQQPEHHLIKVYGSSSSNINQEEERSGHDYHDFKQPPLNSGDHDEQPEAVVIIGSEGETDQWSSAFGRRRQIDDHPGAQATDVLDSLKSNFQHHPSDTNNEQSVSNHEQQEHFLTNDRTSGGQREDQMMSSQPAKTKNIERGGFETKKVLVEYVDGADIPADESRVPADGSLVPADESRVPANGSLVPEEDNIPTAEFDDSGPYLPSFEFALQNRLFALIRHSVYIKEPKGNLKSNYYILNGERDKKLAFCINPKVLSTVMHAIMTFIRYPALCPLKRGRSVPGIFQANRSNSTGRQCYGWKIFPHALRPDTDTADETLYVSVIREPISRFVSGWMDKCYKRKETCYNCPPGDFRCFVQSHYKALASLVVNGTEAYDPSIKRSWFRRTYHWYPQNWVCALTSRNIQSGAAAANSSSLASLSNVRVIPYSRDDSLYTSLTSILRQHQHIPEWKLQLIEDSLSTKVTGHATFKNPFNDNVNRLIETDFGTCRTLYKILKSDFDLFNFKPPWCALSSTDPGTIDGDSERREPTPQNAALINDSDGGGGQDFTKNSLQDGQGPQSSIAPPNW